VSHSSRCVAIATLCIGVWAGLGGAARGAAPAGELNGHVLTPNGQPVAAAEVTLDGAAHLGTTSDNGGAFDFSGVQPGTYALKIAKLGFDQLERSDVLVFGGARTTIDAVLTPSSVSSLLHQAVR